MTIDGTLYGKQGLTVFVRNNDVEGAMKVLKKKMQSEGVFRDMKKHQAYEKPSEKRRRERAEARRRVLKRQAALEKLDI